MSGSRIVVHDDFSRADGCGGRGVTDSLLARSAAPLAIVAGALVVVTRVVGILTAPTDTEPLKVVVLTATHGINSVTSIVAYAMLLFALVACHSFQSQAAGVLGVIGLGAAILGTVFMAGDWWLEAFAVPWLAEDFPATLDSPESGRLVLGSVMSFVLFGIGWLLYGIASVRARVFPTVLSWAVVVSGLLSASVVMVYVTYAGSVILGLAFIVLGAWLMRSRDPRNTEGAAASPTDQPDPSLVA
jgi:hypothetical protein